MTTMLTWQAADGQGFEGARVHFGAGRGFRALGRLVRADPAGDLTASYRLVVAEDGSVERVSITSATAQRERHLTINRSEDGFWLLDTGSGGSRTQFAGAVDVDLAHSALFNALPIRRLDLHREPADCPVPVVFVSLPDLEVTLVEQRYRTVSVGESESVVAFSWDSFAADLVVDEDGVVVSYPGVAARFSAAPGVAQAS